MLLELDVHKVGRMIDEEAASSKHVGVETLSS